MAKAPTGKTLAKERTIRSFKAVVATHESVNEDHRLLTFTLGDSQPPLAGQFYMLGVGDELEPLLKRPFCFFRQTMEGIQVLYRIVGKGTRMLSSMQIGDAIDILGPLGNAYPHPPRNTTPVVITGGIGMASVFPFIESHKGSFTVIYGARTAGELMFTKELEELAAELIITTDDGSQGLKGTVLDALKQKSLDRKTRLYVCGPKPMIQACRELAAATGIQGWASLEEYMACGIGACMGCVCQTTKGYKRVCKEGPIFKLDELV